MLIAGASWRDGQIEVLDPQMEIGRNDPDCQAASAGVTNERERMAMPFARAASFLRKESPAGYAGAFR
jgi:hypothetical protein